ncbi:hypothetical protein EON80_20140, partial [bacterium]
MFFLLFIAAAILVSLGLLACQSSRASLGPRPEGLCFVLSVSVVALVGFAFLALNDKASLDVITTPEAATARSIFPPVFVIGLKFWFLTLAIYVLSALRGLAGLPAWVADILVIVGAFLAVKTDPELLLSIATSKMADSPNVPLGPLALPLTIGWIWMVARFCAALNRIPAVTGGYLGLVGGLVFLLIGATGTSQDVFPATAMIALCGAGLATFAFSLRSPGFNLGWSATLSMGFVLGLSSAQGLLQNTLPAIVALGVLALGVPLLDVTLVQVRARRSDEQEHQTAHQTEISTGDGWNT